VRLCVPLRRGEAGDLPDPVVHAGKDGNGSRYGEHQMEMGNHIVGIVEGDVDGCVGQ